MQIIHLQGEEPKLYQLIAPLVMNPDVLRANNNYPFKTTDKFVWFIAIENEEVKGFMPIEKRSAQKAIINNYYASGKGETRSEILAALLTAALQEYIPDRWVLQAVALIEDKAIFEKFDFTSVEQKWKKYVKMYRM